MGSIGAMKAGLQGSLLPVAADVERSARKLVPEGIEGRVPYKGALSQSVYQLIGGLRAAWATSAARTIEELRTKARFVQDLVGRAARVARARRHHHQRGAELPHGGANGVGSPRYTVDDEARAAAAEVGARVRRWRQGRGVDTTRPSAAARVAQVRGGLSTPTRSKATGCTETETKAVLLDGRTVQKPLRDHLWAVNLSVAFERMERLGARAGADRRVAHSADQRDLVARDRRAGRRAAIAASRCT